MQHVYVFGGRTDGYSCASIYKDSLDLGILNAGIRVYPCTSYQGEVAEIWRLDIMTYTWQLVNVTKSSGGGGGGGSSSRPIPREQHAAATVSGNLYIFGGKSRYYPSAADSGIITTATVITATIVFT
jgi:hypothetical protein